MGWLGMGGKGCRASWDVYVLMCREFVFILIKGIYMGTNT